jgi:hypothetical protein
MTAVAEAVAEEAPSAGASIEATCASVVALNALMSDLYRRIEEFARQRDGMLVEIEATVGARMRARGAKTKTVGDCIVSVGETSRLECLCHAMFLDECPDPSLAVLHGEIRRLAPEPWIKVRAKADADDASAEVA